MRISQDLLGAASPSLDEIDRLVIAALQVEGRRSYSRIASDAGVSESVIRYRVQKLERFGILQIVGIANPLKLGFHLMALIQVKTQPGTASRVADVICTYPEASYIASTAGGYDLLVEVVCRDTAHFNELLTQRLHLIEGVTSTSSTFVMEIHKMAYGWGVAGDRAPMAGDGVEAEPSAATSVPEL